MVPAWEPSRPGASWERAEKFSARIYNCGNMSSFEGIINVGGVKLYVARVGVGPTLLVIHGGPDWDHSYLRSFMHPLITSTDLLFFDLRGCGRSERYPDLSNLHVSHVVEDLRNLILHFEIDHPALLGFSFGGRIGLEFIKCYPNIVSKFILASSSAYPGTRSFVAPQSETVETPEDIRIWAEKSVETEVSSGALESAREAIANIRFSNQWIGALRSGLTISHSDRDYSDALKKSRVPTLILHGECDRTFPLSDATRLAAETPQAQLAIVRNAGHFAHMDFPEEWNDSVFQFLRSD